MLSSMCTRRASSASRIEVSPGVATRARSQRSSLGSLSRDHDVPVWLGALARGRHARKVLQPYVNDLSLHSGHRLQLDTLAARSHPFGASNRERVQRCLAPLPVTRGIDHDRLAVAGAAPIDDPAPEVLNGV